ncbi:hypothetical protein chiPu_0011982 [Chiloscyllium punctatum]|uniref:Uncharacterized protein n=1 Tax=Chiloscyllium punctatum TaxID=137246 RepID=A0A401ST18_CHIPU|nr:hypothetical protein [Chiloscyllium punctatum]
MRHIPVDMCGDTSMGGFPDNCYQQRFYNGHQEELAAQEVPTGLEYSTPECPFFDEVSLIAIDEDERKELK